MTSIGPSAIVVDPPVSLVDAPLRITLVGFPPSRDVTVCADMVDPGGVPWAARAVYRTDAAGRLDLATSAPVSGGTGRADAMGLFWSMRRVGRGNRSLRDKRALPPTTVVLTAEIDAVPVATTTVRRLRLPAGVRRAQVRTNGLFGTLCYPAGAVARPGILLLGGSEGGLHEADAALLAARGYPVLALAYFRAPGLPRALVRIPLEYFLSALDFLCRRRQVDPERLAVVGGSRGGEAALLLASLTPRIRAAASIVGSAVVTQAIGPQTELLDVLEQHEPAWTYRGRPWPYLPCRVPQTLRAAVRRRKPLDLAPAYLSALAEDPLAAAAATIEVERIAGPVLLLTAGDDRIWPCTRLSAVAAERFAAAGRRGDCRHVDYPDAGHLIASPPFGPATARTTAGPGVRLATGGTVAANADARLNMWRELTEFLDRHMPSG